MSGGVAKELQSASTVCWSADDRYPYVFAAGSIAGALDENFKTTSYLSLYNADPALPGIEPEHLACVSVYESNFSKIVWGKKGIDDGSFPSGLIAAGMSDGSLYIWDAEAIKNGNTEPLVKVHGHNASINGLEFQPNNESILATGGADGEVLLWDISDVQNPQCIKPLEVYKGSNYGISSLAWNQSACHVILFCTVSEILHYLSIFHFRFSWSQTQTEK